MIGFPRQWGAIAILVCSWLACVSVPGVLAQTTPVLQRERLLQGQAAQDQVADGVEGLTEPVWGPVEETRLGLLERAIDPEVYILGPGDWLLVAILGGQPIYHRLAILPEGTVFVPEVGPIDASGKSLADFRKDLVRTLRGTYQNVDIYCYLLQVRTFLVYVTGEVNEPGTVIAQGYDRVSDVLRKAGDITYEGSTRTIEIRKGEERIATADLWAFEHRGEYAKNPVIESGQSVFVPFRERVVTVRGRMRRQGEFELKKGEELGDVLDMAGGFLPGAMRDNIRIERITGDGDHESFQTTAGDSGFHLEDRDIVIIPPGDIAEPSVFVEGEGHWEGRLSFQEGDRVSDLLSKIGDFSAQTDLDEVMLERVSEGGERNVVPVDVRAILEGDDSADFLLKEGDALNVPERVQVVYLAGSVKLPGALRYKSDWTVERYIAAAGGPEDRSGFESFEVIRPDGKRRSAKKGDVVYRGETIYLKTRTGQKVVDLFLALGSFTALVLSIVAVSNISN